MRALSGNKTVFSFIFLAMAALFLAGCGGEDATETAAGSVRLSITNIQALISGQAAQAYSASQVGGRTASASVARALESQGLFDYEYWFKAAGGGEPVAPTKPSNGDDTFLLPPGEYTARVKAFVKGSLSSTSRYSEVDSENEVAEANSAPFVVADLEQVSVGLELAAFEGAAGESGSFSYSITRPTGTMITSLMLTPLPTGTVRDFLQDSDNSSESGGLITRSATKNALPAGWYIFAVQLENDQGKTAAGGKALYIYGGRTTEVSYVFAAADFTGSAETPGPAPEGTVKVGITLWDTSESLDFAVGAVLDKNTTQALNALVPSDCTFVAWYLNDFRLFNVTGLDGYVIDEVTHTLTLTTALDVGEYRLTLEAVKDGLPVSKMAKFTVVAGNVGTFDLTAETGIGVGWSFTRTSGLCTLTIRDGGDVTVLGTTTRIRVVMDGTATVTLSGAASDVSAFSEASPLSLGSASIATVRLSLASTLIAGENAAGINVPEGTALKITSASGDAQTRGSLDVQSGTKGAGIGGNSEKKSGTITIAGGTITATGNAAAGIGGGYNSAATITIITGGVVTARGGTSSAGIGGGNRAAGGEITIAGGTVTAWGGQTGAGIGSGQWGSTPTTDISITGGMVTAVGGEYAAGIGGGSYSPGGVISITGGTVATTGGLNGGTGIGGGSQGKGGTISITGGSGLAVGRGGGNSVGPGVSSSGGTFSGSGPVGEDGWPAANPYTWGQGVSLEFTVTFDANGGGNPSFSTKTIAVGQTYGPLPATSRTGYMFAGWYTMQTDGALVTETSFMAAADHTLYAHWTVLTGTFNLESNTGTGGGWVFGDSVVTVLDGAVVTFVGETNRTYIAATGTSTIMLDSAIIDLSKVSGATNVLRGKSALSLQSNARVTLKLSGVSTLAGAPTTPGINVPVGSTLTITSAAGDGQTSGTLAAIGSEKSAGIGGGESAQSGTITIAGGTVSARGGYAGGAGIGGGYGYSGGTITITGGRVSVLGGSGGSGLGGGATGAGGAITITGGGGLAQGLDGGKGAGPGFGNSGGTFNGKVSAWPTDNPYIWGGGVPVEVTVRYHINESTGWPASFQSKTVTVGQTYGELPTATWSGRTLDGWYTERTGGMRVTETTLVTLAAEHTLYAHWSAASYTVTFDANGGETPVPATKSVTYGGTYGTLAAAARTGYTLDGWYTADTGGTLVTESTKVARAIDHTLYAHWIPVTLTVTFDANGGDQPFPRTKTVTYTQQYGELSTATRAGWTLAGWYTEREGGTEVTASTIVVNAENHTLYARWSRDGFFYLDNPGESTGSGWVYNAPELTIQDGTVTLIGSSSTIHVKAAGAVIVTLDGATIDVSAQSGVPALDISGATVSLRLSGTNVLKSGEGAEGIKAPEGSTLAIDGSGEVTVTGGSEATGIGSNGAAGTIAILGGTVTATGGKNKPGIGHGSGDTGEITISGGRVTATGGENAAGIGGGDRYAGGSDRAAGGIITISGGTVIATGTYGGAGIGGGSYGSGGEISITGGEVTAVCGAGAASIGGGFSGAGGTIRINYPSGTSTGSARGNSAWGPVGPVGPGYGGSGGSFNGVTDDWPPDDPYLW